ncbi:NAD(P)-binding domain-containing protein, partial [Jeotgalibaca porci]
MNIGLIGLGKMGFPLLQNMRDNGMSVAAHDINAEMRQSVEAYGATFYETIQELIASLGTEKKVVWLMLPAGAPTETVFQQVLPLLNTGDILIEGGNTHYEDSKRRYQEAAATGISFFDVGTSGGTSGARNGACMMVGGDAERFKEIAHIFEAINIEKGYLYAGESGSGHYLKMVHNGIEYGMMQA